MKQQEKEYEKDNKKTAGNNQWTNNNLKYYPDTRDRKDGPGGNQVDEKERLYDIWSIVQSFISVWFCLEMLQDPLHPFV